MARGFRLVRVFEYPLIGMTFRCLFSTLGTTFRCCGRLFLTTRCECVAVCAVTHSTCPMIKIIKIWQTWVLSQVGCAVRCGWLLHVHLTFHRRSRAFFCLCLQSHWGDLDPCSASIVDGCGASILRPSFGGCSTPNASRRRGRDEPTTRSNGLPLFKPIERPGMRRVPRKEAHRVGRAAFLGRLEHRP